MRADDQCLRPWKGLAYQSLGWRGFAYQSRYIPRCKPEGEGRMGRARRGDEGLVEEGARDVEHWVLASLLPKDPRADSTSIVSHPQLKDGGGSTCTRFEAGEGYEMSGVTLALLGVRRGGGGLELDGCSRMRTAGGGDSGGHSMGVRVRVQIAAMMHTRTHTHKQVSKGHGGDRSTRKRKRSRHLQGRRIATGQEQAASGLQGKNHERNDEEDFCGRSMHRIPNGEGVRNRNKMGAGHGKRERKDKRTFAGANRKRASKECK